jgi:hypothetical protein
LGEQAAGNGPIGLLREPLDLRRWNGEVFGGELDFPLGEPGEDLDFQRVDRIGQHDPSEPAAQEREVEIAEVSASEDQGVAGGRSGPDRFGGKNFAGLQVRAPGFAAADGSVADRNLRRQESAAPRGPGARRQAPFECLKEHRFWRGFSNRGDGRAGAQEMSSAAEF